MDLCVFENPDFFYFFFLDKQFSGFEHMSDFWMNTMFVFVREAPGVHFLMRRWSSDGADAALTSATTHTLKYGIFQLRNQQETQDGFVVIL